MFYSTKRHKRIHPLRHLVLVTLLVLTATLFAGCALNRSGPNTVATLRKDAATGLKQMTKHSTETDPEQKSSSEIVQASFTKEADRDSAGFPIDSAEESEQPEWWTAAETETETENPFSTVTTFSADSTTDVTAGNQTEAWKPQQGWTATKTR
jgi:hypothetical protein